MDEREAKGLKGALVLDPMSGLHTNCVVYLDFKSMYPSIFISYNICPTTLLESGEKVDFMETPTGSRFVKKDVRVGIMPRIVKMLIEERDKVKNKMKASQDDDEVRLLNAKQEALKVVANSFYGYTGYVRAKLYFLQIANSITGCGRYLIQKTRDTVEGSAGYKVIYGDTDSIMVDAKTKDIGEAWGVGKKIEKDVNDFFNGLIQIKIESVFKTLLILTKKRYAGLSMEKKGDAWKEKIVMKGIETVRRDWCDLTGETLGSILQIILKDQDPKKAMEYMKNVVTDLEKNRVAIEKLVVTKSVSKALGQYKGVQPHIEVVKKMRKRDAASAPGIGDRVGYVIVQGSQLTSERAEDPAYVKSKGLKIDSKYYIENQILPPLERVFDAMGISKTELLSLGKQMRLMDAINGAKKQERKIIEHPEGVVCSRCSQTHSRVPLIGKCQCGGEFLFYSGDARARLAQ
jgi:DNA polymerase Pol2